MIRMVVSYPTQPGSRFDLDYYLQKHMPMVIAKLGPHGLSRADVDQGAAGGVPESPPRYQMQAYLTFQTLEGMQAGMGLEGPEILSDIPNFTDVEPEIQVNQVLAHY